MWMTLIHPVVVVYRWSTSQDISVLKLFLRQQFFETISLKIFPLKEFLWKKFPWKNGQLHSPPLPRLPTKCICPAVLRERGHHCHELLGKGERCGCWHRRCMYCKRKSETCITFVRSSFKENCCKKAQRGLIRVQSKRGSEEVQNW